MDIAIGSQNRPLTVAIIGSGPSGFYAADHLIKQDNINIEVDMFDKLPTPYGLVRAGVAPDHQQIKSVTKIYEKLAQNEKFRFWGNIELGKDIPKSEFLNYFDAIIYAVGAQTDRKMNIDGENLKGCHSATDFVGWYNGHPEYKKLEFDFSSKNVIIIGIGNVALDIARIMAKTVEELSKTDIAQHALNKLSKSKIKNIYVIARRGPLQAAFTSAGTKELVHMTEAAAYVNPDELKLEEETGNIISQTSDKRIIQNLQFLEQISNNNPSYYSKIIRFLFRRSPLEIYGNNNEVSGIKIVKNELFKDEFGKLKAKATDVVEDIPAGLIFSSIGYMVNPLPEIPFDKARGTIANINGRVYDLNTKTIVKNEYVTGWAKRGANGVIGTNKPDSIETVDLLLKDFKNETGGDLPSNQKSRIEMWLKSKKLNFVKFDQWKLLDNYETDLGESKNKPREKVTSINEMLKIIQNMDQG